MRSVIQAWRLVMLACALTLGWSLAQAQEPVIESTSSDPPSRAARLSLIDGEVSFAPAGTDEWAEAILNRPITSEDRLWVGADARAELQIGSATVHLDRDTGFGFVELDDDVMQMSVTEGAATLRVRRLSEREDVRVETPNATVRIVHPGEYHFDVAPDEDRTIVKVRSGEAEVTGAGPMHRLQAGRQGVFTGLDTLHAQIDRIEPRTPFEAWANDRERRYERAESARYVSRDVVGYEDLDDHGEWVHEREYGHVWRPRYVAVDWAPYRFGRWAWVSPWGWTWIDDARWGYAPFHYGRWVHLHRRWCWVPGPRHLRPVYAPALVGWVGGPAVSVSVSFGPSIGWFPLGPREIYVPGYRHTPRYIRHVNVSNTIIVNNTYITNVYSGRGRHGDYRYRRHADAITAVHRDHFVAGRSLGRQRVHVTEGQLREWRDDVRPPAIAPRRESVLAAQPRDPRHLRVDDRRIHRGDGRIARLDSGRNVRREGSRLDFETERRAIEANGGRPLPRSELRAATRDNPKDRGDFVRPRGRQEADSVRAERNGSRSVEQSGARDARFGNRELERNRAERGASPRQADTNGREDRSRFDAQRPERVQSPARAERIESLRAEENVIRGERARRTEENAAREESWRRPERNVVRAERERRSEAIERAPAQRWREARPSERAYAAPQRRAEPRIRETRSGDEAPRATIRQAPAPRAAPERSVERRGAPEARARSHDAAPARSHSAPRESRGGAVRQHGARQAER